jgi:hypothetical protein
MRCYEDICRAPISSLTVAENAVDLLENEMLHVRQLANEVRQKWWMDRSDMLYAIGQFQGVRFSMLTLINMFGTHRDWTEFHNLADTYSIEIDFLSGRYIAREVA